MRQNPYLLLIRPANLITSATDIAAGVAIGIAASGVSEGGQGHILSIVLLILASVFLYAGGIAINDVFDAELDRIERPERPIPSGKISVKNAAVYALSLSCFGIILAFYHHWMSGMIAVLIAVFSVLYNTKSKHHAFFGPFNMGFLRALNLLLGVSVVPGMIPGMYWVGIFPLAYIFAITLISQGEVHGGDRAVLNRALLLYILVDAGILIFAFIRGVYLIPVLLAGLHLVFVIPPLLKAIKLPEGPLIGKAVKYGVLGMILMDALWIGTTPFWPWSVLLLGLLPISRKVAKYFAVT